MKLQKANYNFLIGNIGKILEKGRRKAVQTVNQILVQTYWRIGKEIIEYETSTGEQTGYGSGLFERIANDLRQKCGKGFSRTNIVYMRLLYQKCQKSQTLSDQLSSVVLNGDFILTTSC